MCIVKAVRDHLECVTEIEGLNELEFPEGVSWFNTSRPFTAKHDLRGKIVLLEYPLLRFQRRREKEKEKEKKKRAESREGRETREQREQREGIWS